MATFRRRTLGQRSPGPNDDNQLLTAERLGSGGEPASSRLPVLTSELGVSRRAPADGIAAQSPLRHPSEPISVRLLRFLGKRYGCYVSFAGDSGTVTVTHNLFCIDTTPAFIRKLLAPFPARSKGMILGKGYMHGEWQLDSGRLEDALSVLWNIYSERKLLFRILQAARRPRFLRRQKNTPILAEDYIQHHYDHDNSNNLLFDSMLGNSLCYSAAIFDGTHQSLDLAQSNKIDIILDSLQVKPGHRILDIGCGWGTFVQALADRGCDATGITLSREQFLWCEQRKTARSGDQAYRLSDYRDYFKSTSARFDAVTCIEVLDHIGINQYDDFFSAVFDHCVDDGFFFLQLIIRPAKGQTSSWIDKYIYPGGYIASYEEVTSAYRKAGFILHESTPISGWHYAQTLKEWRALFAANWPRVASENKLGKISFNKWMYFFAYSISAFENAGFCNYHLTLRRPRSSAGSTVSQSALSVRRQVDDLI